MPVNSLTEVQKPQIVAQAQVTARKAETWPAVVPNGAAPVQAKDIKTVSPEAIAAKREILDLLVELEKKAGPIPNQNDIDTFDWFTHIGPANYNVKLSPNDIMVASKFNFPKEISGYADAAKEEIHKYFVYLGVLAILSGDTKYFRNPEDLKAPKEYKELNDFNKFIARDNIFTNEEVSQMTNEIGELGVFMQKSKAAVDNNFKKLINGGLTKDQVTAVKEAIKNELKNISEIFLYAVIPNKIGDPLRAEK